MKSLEAFRKGFSLEKEQRIEYQKPSLINTKRLFQYDSNKNALKVCKSKFRMTELKKRGRRSRIDKNLNFLLIDLYKGNDIKANIKNFSLKKSDFRDIFEDFEENCEEFEENHRKNQVLEESQSDSEGFSKEKMKKIAFGVNRKRRRPMSFENPAKNTENKRKLIKRECRVLRARKTVVFERRFTRKTTEKNTEKLIVEEIEKLAFHKEDEEKDEENEGICNDFVIELELDSDKEETLSNIPKEKSFQETKKKEVPNSEKSKKKPENSAFLKKNIEKNSKNILSKTSKKGEIVEIEDDDVVEIQGNFKEIDGIQVIEDEKNIWLDNVTENKINFEYDLEEELL